MSVSKYQAVKGMQDIFPDECRRWVALENLSRAAAGRFGYGEIRVPLVEPTELFVRSIGEGTDIVEKEMFSFIDAGDKSLTLRPEGTAGVVRAFLEKKAYARQSFVKYFYLGPMFRRERPQAGRRRQFHQFGVEALGCGHPALDAEVIDCMLDLLKESGVKPFRLGINSVGCRRCRPVYGEELERYLAGCRGELCDRCRQRLEKNVLRVLDCKNPRCRQAVSAAPVISAFLCPKCGSHYDAFRGFLGDLGIGFDENRLLVRGLDYYTGTVFEVYSPSLGAQDAVAAGGRYDDLIQELGGPALGAVGFSIGMERQLRCLEGKEIPIAAGDSGSVYCVSLNGEAFRKNFRFLSSLRKQGVRGEIDFQGRSLKAQMREANRLGADFALIRGEEEMAGNVVKVKDMRSGQESLLMEERIVEWLGEMKK